MRDQVSLARFVTPVAKLTLSVNRFDLEGKPDGRRELVRALYEGLVGRDIRYVFQKYHPSEVIQLIRPPPEVLEEPREGTCLDLAAVFSGLCLANELLPVLIVLEGHALVAVSLTHGLRDWNHGFRPGRALFETGPLVDPAPLVELIDEGAFLAVECTGFARSERLSQTLGAQFPETVRRDERGLLSFERAVEAGREQLDCPHRAFQFALDVAVAQYGWRIEPNPVARRLEGLGAARFYRSRVERLIGDYRPVFGGRAVQMAALDALLEQDRPYALIHEPSGRGKTALLVHWVSEVESRRRWSVVFAPISRRYETAEANVGLAMLAHALAEFHGGRLGEARSVDDFRRQVFSCLDREPPPGTRLLVVIDGLDEAVGWEVRSDLFPVPPRPRIKVIAAVRQVANRDRAAWMSALGWREEQVCAIALPALDRDGVAEVLRRSPAGVAALAGDEAVLGEIVRISQGDPLSARILVEDLRDGRIDPTRLQLLPEGLERYFHGWLEEVEEKSADSEAAYTLLGLCSAAFGPLTAEDLAALAPEAFRRRVDLSMAAKDLARFLIGDGSEESGYDLSHPRFKELYFERALGRQERSELRQRFVRWGEAWYQDRGGPPSAYLRRFFIAHLAEAGEWNTAQKVLTEIVPAGGDKHRQPWAQARYASEKSWAGYQDDLDVLWRHAEERGDLATAFRCALLTGTTRSLSGGLLPGLLVQLVRIGTPDGRWSPTAALEHVRQIPKPRQQAHTLAVLAPRVEGLPGKLALEIARAIPKDDGRAEALAAVAHLLPDQEPAILAEALDAARETTGLTRGHSLAALAPILPDDLVDEAVAEAQKQGGPESLRASALASLLPRLPKRRQIAVKGEIEAALRGSSLGDYVTVRTKLARVLPKREAAAALEQAKAAARRMPLGWECSEALIRLAPLLPEGEQAGVLQEAVAAAQQPDTQGTLRGLSLARIAGLLPEEDRAGVLAEALAEIRKAHRGRVRLWEPADVAQAVAETSDAVLAMQVALYGLEGILEPPSTSTPLDTDNTVEALVSMARLLPEDLLDEALAAAREIKDPYRRAPVLAALAAARLPKEQQASVVEEAFSAALYIGDVGARASALADLVSRLPQERQADVLQEVRAAAHQALGVHALIDAYFEWVRLAVAAQEILARAEARLAAAGTTGEFIAENLAARAKNLKKRLPERLPATVEEALLVARTILHKESETGAAGAPAARRQAAPMEKDVTVGHPQPREQLVGEAVAEARLVADGSRRAWVLAALAPLLAEREQATTLSEALVAARNTNDAVERARAEGLAVLASVVPRDRRASVTREAIGAALKIRSPHVRAAALAALAPVLTDELGEEALVEVRQLSFDEGRGEATRSQALVALALRLSAARRDTVVKEAWAAARKASDDSERAKALAGVADLLEGADRTAVLKEARAAAQRLDGFENLRAKALAAVARRLSSKPQARLVDEALDAARNEPAAHRRSEALAAVAPLLRGRKQAAVLEEALAAAWRVKDHDKRVKALAAVAPLVGSEKRATVVEEALAAARKVETSSADLPRFKALATVAALLPDEERAAVLEEALAAAREHDIYRLVRAEALITLAPLMSKELLVQALAEARKIPAEGDRLDAMSVVVPRFTEACLRSRDDALLTLQWQRTVRELAIHGREPLLYAVPLLAVWAATLAEPDTLGEFAAATIQAARWWP